MIKPSKVPMAMDAKDLRIDTSVGNNDGSKYNEGGSMLQCDRNKSYQDMASSPLGKADAAPSRPCAVIGPDRVLPRPTADAFPRKPPVETWPTTDNPYGRPPEYPYKMLNYQNPTRNISPRQTFQENMQRIMVQPRYNNTNSNEDINYPTERSMVSKNLKLNMPSEAKYCDVPYPINHMNSDQKNVRNTDSSANSINPALVRNASWHQNTVGLRPNRPYGVPEMYQYPEFQSCAGPRPVPIMRPHKPVQEEAGPVFSDAYFNERFKPYPNVKERYPPPRYEYINNGYQNPHHPLPPVPFQSNKYDFQKNFPPHAYASYPQMPVKYMDGRMPETIDGYQRPPTHPTHYNLPVRNPVVHPSYGPVATNSIQNKMFSYPPENSVKSVNKLPYDNKMFEYENVRNKMYGSNENPYINEISRSHIVKNQIMPPNYSLAHGLPPHLYYKKDLAAMRNYEYYSHFRNMDPNLCSPIARYSAQFSPSTIAISPSDSNTSNDTIHTQSTLHEDYGYVSQSPAASVRSMDSGINRHSADPYRRFDHRSNYMVQNSQFYSKCVPDLKGQSGSKNKKDIDVRQFLQMWNEGEEENTENKNEEGTQVANDEMRRAKQYQVVTNQDQLYVLDLVNVPTEELGKYEHIQKVSKLPENIKGYNSIELLDQFEEAIESSNLNFKVNSQPTREVPMKNNRPVQATIGIPRPVSPLDVEAKISQSVIHKEVGCNFEIKPCSPKMLNAEVAAPAQKLLGERAIEKISNPIVKSPVILHTTDGNNVCSNVKNNEHLNVSCKENVQAQSCQMMNKQYSNEENGPTRENYSLQDLESNSGVCLASLPRLDNDIELNFPEVNQQFINANKNENVFKDLPTLDLDSTVNIKKDFEHNSVPTTTNLELHSPNIESDKEFVKLSKFRKLKKSCNMTKDIQASRTDSVIIKNPDNTKTDDQNFTSGWSDTNLVSNNDKPNDHESTSSNIDCNLKTLKEEDIFIDEAINFSLRTNRGSGIILNTGKSLDPIIDNDADLSNKKTVSDDQSLSLECENLVNPYLNNLKENQKSNIVNSSSLDNDQNETENISELNLKTTTCLETINPEKPYKVCENTTSTILNSENQDSLIDADKNKVINENPSTEINLRKKNCIHYNHEVALSTNYDTRTLSFTSKVKCDSKQDSSENKNIEKEIHNQVYQDMPKQYSDSLKFNNVSLKLDNEYEKEVGLDLSITVPVKDDISPIFFKNDECNDTLFEKRSFDNVEASTIEINKAYIKAREICLNHSPIDDEMLTKKQVDDIAEDGEQYQFHTAKPQEIIPNESTIKEFCKKQNKINETKSEENLDYNEKNVLNTYNKADVSSTCTYNFKTDIKSEKNELGGIDSEGQPQKYSETSEILRKHDVTDILLHNNKKEHLPAIDKALGINIKENEPCNISVPFYMKNICGKKTFCPWIQKLSISEVGLCVPNFKKDFEMQEKKDNNNHALLNLCIPDESNFIAKYKSSEIIELKMLSPIYSSSISNSSDESLQEDQKGHYHETDSKENDFQKSPVSQSDHCENEKELCLSDSNKELETDCESDRAENCDLDVVENMDLQSDLVNHDILSLKHLNSHSETVIDEAEVSKNVVKTLKTSTDDSVLQTEVVPRTKLKRSLSESMISMLKSESSDFCRNLSCSSNKRQKIAGAETEVQNYFVPENFCKIFQTNRRNSVSSMCTDQNVSFCIVIDDNCMISEESEGIERISFAEVTQECHSDQENDAEQFEEHYIVENTESINLDDIPEDRIEESWVDDIGCMETVMTDDIAEDVVISASSSPTNDDYSGYESNNEFSDINNSDEVELMDKVKYIYGNQMCNDDAQFVETLYHTPQMDVKKKLIDNELNNTEGTNYSSEECNTLNNSATSLHNSPESIHTEKENSCPISEMTRIIAKEKYEEEISIKFPKLDEIPSYDSFFNSLSKDHIKTECLNEICNNDNNFGILSCESSDDGVFTTAKEDSPRYSSSSSPEVSSTTSEEKCPGILLKISNYKGSKISQINDKPKTKLSCKFTEKSRYSSSNQDYSRPLLTKAAQKYIPPIKETIGDLKVKLSLPKQSLMKLKMLKISKDKPKLDDIKTLKGIDKYNYRNKEIIKRQKPKFEDVLKSIDETNFKMLKEKSKKSKKSIPKVFIKKNENGSHYASTSRNDTDSPDLTGRKWQPWVFLEKNNFVDKMALKRKTKAIFNHRKNTFVLAENFFKYKSVSSNFVINHQKLDDSSHGQLKYTIRLKHSY